MRADTTIRRTPWDLVSLALAGALAIAPVTAPASPSPPDPATEVDVGALWREATTRLETSDYEGAIEILTRVYDAVARDPEARALRVRVRWALHQAHLGAHEIDHDRAHLHAARDLLRKAEQDFDEGDATMREQTAAALAEVERRIAEVEAAEEAAAAAAPARTPPPVEPAHPRAEDVPPPVPPTPARPWRPLVAGGGAALGIGAVGIGLLAGGFATAGRAVDTFESDPLRRAQARDDIQRGNAIGTAGAVIAGVMITVGAVLLAVGLRRRSATASRALSLRAAPR